MHGAAVPASFLVTTVAFDEPPPDLVASHDPEATSLRIAALLATRTPQGEVRDMPAGMAVRSRQDVAATSESQQPGTRLDYHWPLPSQPLKWVLATFTTLRAPTPEDDVTDLLVDLFDAIMLTWRWSPALIL
jgi:hypothetical protein